MAWLGWIGGIAAVLLLLIGFSPVRARAQFIRETENDHLSVQIVAIYGLVKYKMEVPYIDFKGLWKGISFKAEETDMNRPSRVEDVKERLTLEKITKQLKQLRRLIDHVRGFDDWLWSTLSHVKCTQIQWTTRVGLDDAADTAVAVGALWALKTTLLGLIFRRIRLEARPRLAVEPQYNQAVFSTVVLCIAEIRLGYAMIAGLLFIVRILRAKEGVKTWQSILFRA